jgi:hypothetical protein
MKKQFRIICFLQVLLLLLLVVFSGCSSNTEDILDVDNEGNTSINNESLQHAINQDSTQPLNDIEEEGILYMREEEKLARDVYLQLYELWGTNNFNNIGSSEQTHMDAMGSLIERYNLDDPVKDEESGQFMNQELQQLYDELVEQGSRSEIDALMVGAAIEEIDIIDIEEYVAQTDKQDIITVYDNLLKGSRNHLRSFVSVLKKRGVTYEPQYLSNQTFNEIISATIETGRS